MAIGEDSGLTSITSRSLLALITFLSLHHKIDDIQEIIARFWWGSNEKHADFDCSMKSLGVVSIQGCKCLNMDCSDSDASATWLIVTRVVIIAFTIFVNEITWANNVVKASTLWTHTAPLAATCLVDGH
ncbi:hypothetical protein WN943_029739 [Citrus x changshan-huyou]